MRHKQLKNTILLCATAATLSLAGVQTSQATQRSKAPAKSKTHRKSNENNSHRNATAKDKSSKTGRKLQKTRAHDSKGIQKVLPHPFAPLGRILLKGKLKDKKNEYKRPEDPRVFESWETRGSASHQTFAERAHKSMNVGSEYFAKDYTELVVEFEDETFPNNPSKDIFYKAKTYKIDLAKTTYIEFSRDFDKKRGQPLLMWVGKKTTKKSSVVPEPDFHMRGKNVRKIKSIEFKTKDGDSYKTSVEDLFEYNFEGQELGLY